MLMSVCQKGSNPGDHKLVEVAYGTKLDDRYGMVNVVKFLFEIQEQNIG